MPESIASLKAGCSIVASELSSLANQSGSRHDDRNAFNIKAEELVNAGAIGTVNDACFHVDFVMERH
jgi:hypothetical protein